MKNMRRAYRRYKKWVKFKKRVEEWTRGTYILEPETREEWVEEIYKGETHNFLKTTGKPCSCSMCSYDKYKRTQSQYIQKGINEQIDDNET